MKVVGENRLRRRKNELGVGSLSSGKLTARRPPKVVYKTTPKGIKKIDATTGIPVMAEMLAEAPRRACGSSKVSSAMLASPDPLTIATPMTLLRNMRKRNKM